MYNNGQMNVGSTFLSKFKQLFVVFTLVLLSLFAHKGDAFAGGSKNYNYAIQKRVFENRVEETDEVFESQDNKPNEILTNKISLNQKDWTSLALGTLFGWLLGFLSVYIVDKLKEPNLVFEVGSVAEKHPTMQWRFIHIKIKNFKKYPRLNPFKPTPAFECKASVEVKDKTFVGRWTSKAQPIGSNIGEIINKALVHPRETIHPYTNEYEAVEVVLGIKYENEDEFYGFNNESYLPQYNNLKNPNYKFPKGTFRGKLTISTMGQTYCQHFKIYNKSKHRKDFWLELVN
jgi:hypothetical protein